LHRRVFNNVPHKRLNSAGRVVAPPCASRPHKRQKTATAADRARVPPLPVPAVPSAPAVSPFAAVVVQVSCSATWALPPPPPPPS
jgi:hypothetical protein